MKSLFIKGSLVLALAAVFGMPNASAAPLVAVEPTIAVVDGNHAAIVGANG
ncbi:Tat (Twin-arginine translocation) pathway signal sequence, partial [human gut metagenome]